MWNATSRSLCWELQCLYTFTGECQHTLALFLLISRTSQTAVNQYNFWQTNHWFPACPTWSQSCDLLHDCPYQCISVSKTSVPISCSTIGGWVCVLDMPQWPIWLGVWLSSLSRWTITTPWSSQWEVLAWTAPRQFWSVRFQLRPSKYAQCFTHLFLLFKNWYQ